MEAAPEVKWSSAGTRTTCVIGAESTGITVEIALRGMRRSTGAAGTVRRRGAATTGTMTKEDGRLKTMMSKKS